MTAQHAAVLADADRAIGLQAHKRRLSRSCTPFSDADGAELLPLLDNCLNGIISLVIMQDTSTGECAAYQLP